MKKWLGAGLLMFVVGCATEPNPTPVATPASSLTDAAPQARRSYIVVYQDNTVNASALSGSLMRQHGFATRFGYTSAIQGFAADLTDSQVEALRRDPRVRLVEADAPVRADATQSPAPSWGLDRIDQANLPLDNSYTYVPTGAGVRFYGIDTGILYSHADFGGRASAGFDAVTAGGGAVDCDGHGTHTASTAAGTTYGVAKGMTIIGVRVLDCNGSGTTSGVIAGVDWVRANAIKPAVANMSLGGGPSSALNTAVANAIASGVVFTVSAGNSNANACNASPASTPTALTVGSTTTTDARSSFSNFGTCVDLFAPGSSIRAAYIPSGSAVLSGTSMAAPHVAGVAGLYLQQNPTATPAAVAAALLGNAVSGKVTSPGTGSPNLLLSMAFLNGGAPPPPPPVNQPPVASFTSSCTGLQCSFNGTGSTDDNGVTGYSWTFGDGTTGTGSTPTKTYAAAGTYSVVLTVTDAGGLTNATTRSVTVTAPTGNQAPVAVPVVTCVPGRSCTFDGRGSTDDVRVVGYEWRNVRGNLVSRQATFSRFLDVGTLTWTLTVVDGAGLRNTKSVTFTVLP
ncbi:MAG: S8 family peptidase [Gemmatimonadales bacterium]|nr:S8 family peptidase [Gemmatimonadales bacterium]